MAISPCTINTHSKTDYPCDKSTRNKLTGYKYSLPIWWDSRVDLKGADSSANVVSKLPIVSWETNKKDNKF